MEEKHQKAIAEHEQKSKDLIESHAAAVAALQETIKKATAEHEQKNKDLIDSHATAVAALEESHQRTIAEHKTPTRSFLPHTSQPSLRFKTGTRCTRRS